MEANQIIVIDQGKHYLQIDFLCTRMAQFFKMFPAPPLIANRMEILAEKMEKCGFKPSELGMKLFGLKGKLSIIENNPTSIQNGRKNKL